MLLALWVPVELVHLFSHGGCAAAGDFFDGGQAVFLVAGVDALGAVAAVEALDCFVAFGSSQ